MSASQLGHLVQNLVHLVAGYSVGEAVPNRLPLDGRWVTPGDLWRLPDPQVRGLLSTAPVALAAAR